MSVQEWQIVAGAVMSAVALLGPWMFMVHAKLAVLTARIGDLAEKLEKANDANHELWTLCSEHAIRIETHGVQLTFLANRLEALP